MGKGSGNGTTRGDRKRNARRERLRGLLPRDGAVIGIDLAEDKQALAVVDHDVRVLARKTVKVKAFVSEISGDTHMSRKQLITDGNNPLKRKIVEPRDIYKPPDQQDTINDSARPINAENTQTEQASKRATVVQYGTYLPRILVRQLKRYAFDNEIPATQVVQSAIRDYLAEHNGHPTK